MTESDGKPQKRQRDFFASRILKRKEKSPLTPAQVASTENRTENPTVSPEGSRHTQNAKDRYLIAEKALQEALTDCKTEWRSFAFPELGSEQESVDAQFKRQIDVFWDNQKAVVKDQKAWDKCKDTVTCIFLALSPFTKTLLTVGSNVQSV